MKAIALILSLLMIFCFGFFLGSSASEVGHPLSHKTIKLLYSLKNTTSKALTNVEFVAFLPGLDKPEVVNLSANHDYSIADLQGNSRLIINKEVVSPYFSTEILVTSVVLVDEQYRSLEEVEKPDVSDVSPEVFELSREVADIDDDYIRAVSVWVSSNIQQDKYNPQLQSISKTLSSGSGDCTDMAALAIELLAAKGVYSVMVGGFVVKGESELVSARDYHNWLYFFSEERWKLMDPSNGLITEKNTDYIPFDLVASRTNYQRFSTNYPEIELRLK